MKNMVEKNLQIFDSNHIMGQTTSTPSAAAAPAPAPIPAASNAQAPARCPVDHSAMKAKASAAPASASAAPAQCPVQHDDVNPRNQMPNLPQHSISMNQEASLSTERVSSTIPRDERSTWDYPSPQQFYNALVRKGWETPEEHVDTMVDIHNFLNEQAWGEVLKWEERVNGAKELQLAKFKGRPGELSPKARLFMLAGRVFPSQFSSDPPFDRHDWIVRRKSGEEVRYVIDYYSLPDEPNGTPVFSLDVRPALDSFSSIKTRVAVAAEEGWARLRQQSAAPQQTNDQPTSSR